MGKKCETVYTEDTKRLVLIIKFSEEYENFDIQKTPMYLLIAKVFLYDGIYECGHVVKLEGRTFIIQVNFDNTKRFRKYLQGFLYQLQNNDLPLLGVDSNGVPLKVDSVTMKVAGANDDYKIYAVDGELMSKKQMILKIADIFKNNLMAFNGLVKENFSLYLGLEKGESISGIVGRKDADPSWSTVPTDDWKGGLAVATDYYPTEAEIAIKTSKVKKYYNFVLTLDLSGSQELYTSFNKWCSDLSEFGVDQKNNIDFIKCYENEGKYIVEQSFKSKYDFYIWLYNAAWVAVDSGYENVEEFIRLLLGDPEWTYTNKWNFNASKDMKYLYEELWGFLQYVDIEFVEGKFSFENINNGKIMSFINPSQKVYEDEGYNARKNVESQLKTEVTFLQGINGSQLKWTDAVAVADVKMNLPVIVESKISVQKNIDSSAEARMDFELIAYGIAGIHKVIDGSSFAVQGGQLVQMYSEM